MTSQNPTESSQLFSPYNSSQNIISQDDIIESRLLKRHQDFINSEEDFTKIKESTMSSELSLGENSRNLIFKQRRLRQNIIAPEITQSLKDKLSIPYDWFEKCNNTVYSLADISQIISDFKTNTDIKQKFFGLVGLRKILLTPNVPIEDILNEGIIEDLIKLLELNSNPEFKYESLLCLSYLTSKTNEQIAYLIINKGIRQIFKIFDSPIEEIKLQVPLLIGNLISNSYGVRDLLIKEKIYDKLLTILTSTNNKNLIKNCTWSISNFFRIKPILKYETAKKSIKIFARNLLLLQDDFDFLSDACFILCFMTENYKEGIKELMEFNIIEAIIKLLACGVVNIQITCLRLIGNIAAGNANQTQKQIEKLISEDFLLIFEKTILFDEPEVKKECIWAMCNLTSVKNPVFLKKILEQGILICIQQCLLINDTKNLAVSLEALSNLLEFGNENKINGVNPVVSEIERLEMYNILEELQKHPVEIIYEKTLKLLLDYFDVQYNI